MHSSLAVVQRQVIVMLSIKNIAYETTDAVIQSTPISELPKEILDYYKKNDYEKRGIPLSVKTVKEIAKILEKENEHGQNKNH